MKSTNYQARVDFTMIMTCFGNRKSTKFVRIQMNGAVDFVRRAFMQKNTLISILTTGTPIWSMMYVSLCSILLLSVLGISYLYDFRNYNSHPMDKHVIYIQHLLYKQDKFFCDCGSKSWSIIIMDLGNS